jgi:hypothetical protein
MREVDVASMFVIQRVINNVAMDITPLSEDVNFIKGFSVCPASVIRQKQLVQTVL